MGFVAYLGLLAAAPRLGRAYVWTAIVVGVGTFAALPPLLSHDVYSYIDYARLGTLHGLDPYIHPPAAAPQDPAFADVTWIDTTSAYGPLFTLATYPLAWLPVGVAVLVLKATTAASVLVLAAVVARIAPARGVDPLRAAAFVALNPLVLVHVVGGAHNDALAMVLATLGVAAILTAREAAGGAALVAAVAIKASTAVLAPFALVASTRKVPGESQPVPRFANHVFGGKGTAERGRLAHLLAGALAATVAIGVGAQLAFGWDWLHAFGLAGENQGQTSHMSLPVTLARLSDLPAEPVRIAALVLYAALIAFLLARTWQGLDWVRAAGWASLGLLLATSWLLPWYLIWALPLAALSRDRTLQILTLALTAYQLGARIPL